MKHRIVIKQIDLLEGEIDITPELLEKHGTPKRVGHHMSDDVELEWVKGWTEVVECYPITLKFEGWLKVGEDGDVMESTAMPVSQRWTHPEAYALAIDHAEKVWEFETVTEDPDKAWIEAMTKWHEFQGWEPYKPMGEDDDVSG